MDLSVIVATTDASRSIDECLRCLVDACRGLDAELIVVDASNDDTPDRVRRSDAAVTLLCYRPGMLTPQLWAEGYRVASGRRIAFTTGHCLVSRQWASTLLSALDGGAAGAGGPLELAREAGGLDRAVFYLRYSAFMPRTIGSGLTTGEIAGDNAMYGREWLSRHDAALKNGFWEVDFHRLVRADGGWLAAVTDATARFGRSFPAATILGHRFAHGRHFGAGRVQGGRRRAWQVVMAAPLVPLVMAGRVWARVRTSRIDRRRFIGALPWFVLLAAAWAAGEAVGAVRGAAIPVVERRQAGDGGLMRFTDGS